MGCRTNFFRAVSVNCRGALATGIVSLIGWGFLGSGRDQQRKSLGRERRGFHPIRDTVCSRSWGEKGHGADGNSPGHRERERESKAAWGHPSPIAEAPTRYDTQIEAIRRTTGGGISTRSPPTFFADQGEEGGGKWVKGIRTNGMGQERAVDISDGTTHQIRSKTVDSAVG